MFAVSRFFHLQTFIFSLAIGLFLVYIQTPEFNTIYVYPNPDNEDKILYKDKTNTCHEMKKSRSKMSKRCK